MEPTCVKGSSVNMMTYQAYTIELCGIPEARFLIYRGAIPPWEGLRPSPYIDHSDMKKSADGLSDDNLARTCGGSSLCEDFDIASKGIPVSGLKECEG